MAFFGEEVASTASNCEGADLLRALAGEPADRYLAEFYMPAMANAVGLETPALDQLKTALSDQEMAFRAFLANYAATRRSPAREQIAPVFLHALDLTLGGNDFAEYLESHDAEALWLSFDEAWTERTGKSAAPLRPVLEGTAELVFEIFETHGHGNVFRWACDEIARSRRVEAVFLRLKAIRTLGPKTASHFLRDTVILYDLEDDVDYADRIYLQPISSVVRRLAARIVPEAAGKRLPDWVLAGKMSKQARLAGVSGVRFNIGCAYLGLRLALRSGGVERAVEDLLRASGTDEE
ncbi:MAG: hypothetical protein IH851_04645 [Armatimonadetes bacterium]|nr:hypothetical protein [Armatimonadota bacterium]